MKEQNYSNHRRYVPGFHFVLSALIFISLVGSITFIVRSVMHGHNQLGSIVVFICVVDIILLYLYTRQFPIKAQDRAIRAEENLRHFVLTGKLFDPRLSIKQIVALRFASDLELAELAARAVTENLSNDDIKKAVKSWRVDNDRA
jgi:hypothetical protein